MEFKAYHKIKQFKDVVRAIQHQANFRGLDIDGEPIYEETEKPTITFKGTVKLHGTNAGICYYDGKMLAQKRSSFLEVDRLDSHMGFNIFVQVAEKENFYKLMEKLYTKYCVSGNQITLYGEWAGKGIQKGVGISTLDKAFYIFDCRIYNPVEEESRWVDVSEFISELSIPNVYNMHQFESYSMDIDFNNPGLVQNKLIEITSEVERECPVTRQLGGAGIGEGVVWTGYYKGEKYIFKVKGEKHSTTKVKKLASVDVEVLKSIQEFVDFACTKNRIEQGITEVGAKEKSDTPELLRWVANDIMAEESDTLKANNLEWKQVARECSNKVRQYFFSKLDTI
jgi:hypothetical protein